MATIRQRRKSGNSQSLQIESTDSQGPHVGWDQMDRKEKISIICNYFIKGLPYTEIARRIASEYKAAVSRESIYPTLVQAVKQGWIRYTPPQHMVLEHQLKERYAWLIGTKVAHTAQFDEVAYYGAESLIDLLKQLHHQGKSHVHIGFAGGHAMRMVANQFAAQIDRSQGNIPRKLTLHALVAGFDVYEPTTDPNTFFTLFESNKPSGIEFRFVGLHTPPVVKTDDYQNLSKQHGIKESYEEAAKIDIIVTSATNWDDDHSTFKKYMQISPNCYDLMEQHHCVGDMLWMPIGWQSLIQARTDIRAMTLMELSQLPQFIAQGKHVLLVLGPCGSCQRTKSQILKAILDQKERLITHLVADSRSVRDMLNSSG
jgi:DNA-binding transcriptional regulator LsrR (DeoR family)